MTVPLSVSGVFHSPLMAPAREELAAAIEATEFHTPKCPIYQNVDALPHTNPEEIKANLDSDISSDLNSAPVTLSPIRSKEYKVVEFFYKGYSWLHHLLYALAWLIFTAWFFWPGIKMQKQKTIIKH